MIDNRRQILDMLAQGKINADEAERLISLVDQPSAGEPDRADASDTKKPSPKYLRVIVEPASPEAAAEGAKRVNIRVPMALIRAGVKVGAILSSETTAKVNQKLQEKGIDIDLGALKVENVEELVNAIADLEVDVHEANEKVRIFVE